MTESRVPTLLDKHCCDLVNLAIHIIFRCVVRRDGFDQMNEDTIGGILPRFLLEEFTGFSKMSFHYRLLLQSCTVTRNGTNQIKPDPSPSFHNNLNYRLINRIGIANKNAGIHQ